MDYAYIDRVAAPLLAALTPGEALVVYTSERHERSAVGTRCPDPGPGFWDRNLDIRTEQPTPRDHVLVAGRVYLARNHAPSRCPSGPCGRRVVLVATDRVVEHTQHSLERCVERGIDPDVALAIARQELGGRTGATTFVATLDDGRAVAVEAPDGRIATVYHRARRVA